jgi:hypothetical protein
MAEVTVLLKGLKPIIISFSAVADPAANTDAAAVAAIRVFLIIVINDFPSAFLVFSCPEIQFHGH